MKKRLAAIAAAFLLAISAPETILACNQEQSDLYTLQILFGNDYLAYEADENVEILFDALYLCCEQADESGTEELEYLKENDVGLFSSLSKIDIDSDELFYCSHNSWEYTYTTEKKKQNARKKLLRSAVNEVFDFGLVNELLNSDKGQTNSFAALLYYTHILADYLADDPEETETPCNGKAVPAYSGQPYIEINGNVPEFSKKERKNTEAFATYSELDSLGRCGVAYVNVCSDIMPPSGSRQQIGMIQPSGWNQGKYPGLVASEPAYLFNRCHLVAHELAGNDSENNLITGTRFLNITGMLPFENKVADYVRETGNHVLYRSTPVFKGDNLIASGVQLEAYSVEDDGEGICFNVFCYNVQPGIDINYTNGNNEIADKTYKKDDILPFAVSNPSDSSPDLIFEMNKHLEILFEDQTQSLTYTSMLQEIETIANKARSLCDQAEADAKAYQSLNSLEYQYLDVLKANVPLLLDKEDFFDDVF